MALVWQWGPENLSENCKKTAKTASPFANRKPPPSREAEITELDPDYLKKHRHATAAEIERFKRSGYQSLEIHTIDQMTGEVTGFLFDSLRCLATGKGKREGHREVMEWEWRTGHKSTHITERVSADRVSGIERTPNP